MKEIFQWIQRWSLLYRPKVNLFRNIIIFQGTSSPDEHNKIPAEHSGISSISGYMHCIVPVGQQLLSWFCFSLTNQITLHCRPKFDTHAAKEVECRRLEVRVTFLRLNSLVSEECSLQCSKRKHWQVSASEANDEEKSETLTSFVGGVDGLRRQTKLVHQRPELPRRQSAAEHAHSLQTESR